MNENQKLDYREILDWLDQEDADRMAVFFIRADKFDEVLKMSQNGYTPLLLVAELVRNYVSEEAFISLMECGEISDYSNNDDLFNYLAGTLGKEKTRSIIGKNRDEDDEDNVWNELYENMEEWFVYEDDFWTTRTIVDKMSQEEADLAAEFYASKGMYEKVVELVIGDYEVPLHIVEFVRAMAGTEVAVKIIETGGVIRDCDEDNIFEYLTFLVGNEKALNIVSRKYAEAPEHYTWSNIFENLDSELLVQQKNWEALFSQGEYHLLAENGQYDILIDKYDDYEDVYEVAEILHEADKYAEIAAKGKFDWFRHMENGVEHLEKNKCWEMLFSMKEYDVLAKNKQHNILISNFDDLSNYCSEKIGELLHDANMYNEIVKAKKFNCLAYMKDGTSILIRHGRFDLALSCAERLSRPGSYERSKAIYKEMCQDTDGAKYLLEQKKYAILAENGQTDLLKKSGKWAAIAACSLWDEIDWKKWYEEEFDGKRPNNSEYQSSEYYNALINAKKYNLLVKDKRSAILFNKRMYGRWLSSLL